MTKATRMMEENIKLVDAVIYVLDSRCPLACINPHFNAIIGSRPIVYALNKSDLITQADASEWITALTSATTSAVALDSTRSGGARSIPAKLKGLLSAKINRFKEKGVNYTVRAMVIGVPNTGKSTLINNLCGKARAAAGNRPGVTRGKQWLAAGEYLELLDTPGVLSPRLEDQRLAYHLAYCGSVKDDILDIFEVSSRLFAEILPLYPAEIAARYGEVASLEDIARARGFLLKGGIADTERAASAFLDDFRKGRLGRLILERADEYV